MQKRYERNLPAISEEQQALLSAKKVLILGCGGLGGYVAEYLARLGVGALTVVDGDCFEESNLNRQLTSSPSRLGQNKAAACARRIREIAPEISVSAVEASFDKGNGLSLIKGQDLVMDALDNLPSRLLMEKLCEKENIPFVHGAILGWSMQIAVGQPGSRILRRLYGNAAKEEPCKTSLAMTPAACAAIETAEALKILTGQPPSLNGKLFYLNLQTMEQQLLSLELLP